VVSAGEARLPCHLDVFGKVKKQLSGIEGESVLSLFDFAVEVAESGGGFATRK